MRSPEALFKSSGLSGHEVREMGKRFFDVEEADLFRRNQIGGKRLREREILEIGSDKEVERDRSSTQISQIGRTYVVL